ncbi:hypothetical protein HYU23_03530 [Candidatus Woesearchaeota archaeon]|nr:hypothetical protein [Candidatus Woesearchaeota archaeon]
MIIKDVGWAIQVEPEGKGDKIIWGGIFSDMKREFSREHFIIGRERKVIRFLVKLSKVNTFALFQLEVLVILNRENY